METFQMYLKSLSLKIVYTHYYYKHRDLMVLRRVAIIVVVLIKKRVFSKTGKIVILWKTQMDDFLSKTKTSEKYLLYATVYGQL